MDEARTLVQFNHKNIVSVIRFIQAHGTAYIVMEFIDGETLSDVLKREKTLSYERLKATIDPILSGLEVIHKAELIHRDIKPGNIIIRKDGTPVLIDFGSARHAIGGRSRSITAIVTPGYAPIEQYSTRGKQGPWTDIYALAAICYHAITGKAPVDATDRASRDPFVPLMDRKPAPDHILKAIDKALLFNEEDRPQNIAAWRNLLDVGDAFTSLPYDEMAKKHLLNFKPNNSAEDINRRGKWKPAMVKLKTKLKSIFSFTRAGLLAFYITLIGTEILSDYDMFDDWFYGLNYDIVDLFVAGLTFIILYWGVSLIPSIIYIFLPRGPKTYLKKGYFIVTIMLSITSGILLAWDS